MNSVIVVLLVLLLAGCSEGGIGGTGTVIPPIPVTGQGNKGPFVAGARLTATPLSTSIEPASGGSTGVFGGYQLNLRGGAPYQLQISGKYFSESTGMESTGVVTLDAIAVAKPLEPININVATHLVRQRVTTILSNTMPVETAIDAATAELTLTLASVIKVPANPIQFSQLVVVNAAQPVSNTEGNAWLLALSALIEQAAAGDVQGFITSLAQDFATDGSLDNSRLALLLGAARDINPDAIHQNLLGLNPAFQVDALIASGSFPATTATQSSCRVFGSRYLCTVVQDFPTGSFEATTRAIGSADSSTLDLETVVADLNRFVDSDADGLVNVDDDDDDNDGIADQADDDPYDPI